MKNFSHNTLIEIVSGKALKPLDYKTKVDYHNISTSKHDLMFLSLHADIKDEFVFLRPTIKDIISNWKNIGDFYIVLLNGQSFHVDGFSPFNFAKKINNINKIQYYFSFYGVFDDYTISTALINHNEYLNIITDKKSPLNK